MDDLNTRDEELARERQRELEKVRKEELERQRELEKAAEKGRLEEQEKEKEAEKAREKAKTEEIERQREREQAVEKGRKQGVQEGRSSQGGGGGTGIKVFIAIVVIALIVVLAAILTLNVSVTPVSTGDTYPFTTSYGVSFPEGQTVTIANTRITVLSDQNQLISDIDGARQTLVVGQSRGISERRAVVTTLGVVTLMDTNFQANLTYLGEQNNHADFVIAIHTTKQVPNYLIQKLLPPEIDARPV